MTLGPLRLFGLEDSLFENAKTNPLLAVPELAVVFILKPCLVSKSVSLDCSKKTGAPPVDLAVVIKDDAIPENTTLSFAPGWSPNIMQYCPGFE